MHGSPDLDGGFMLLILATPAEDLDTHSRKVNALHLNIKKKKPACLMPFEYRKHARVNWKSFIDLFFRYDAP